MVVDLSVQNDSWNSCLNSIFVLLFNLSVEVSVPMVRWYFCSNLTVDGSVKNDCWYICLNSMFVYFFK